MKDMTGREIQMGDRIVYASKPSNYPVLTEGVVLKVDADSVKVDRFNVGGEYDFIVNKVRKFMNWRAGTVTDGRSQSISATRICCPSRCFITSR